MSRKLPPLNALRAFEAAARHLSFTRASEELFVTQAAVSHQIKALEDWLGFKLFHRMGRGLHLTEEGQVYRPVLRDAFDDIAAATERLMRADSEQRLTMSTTDSFAAGWLVQRLKRFRTRHPEIDVRVTTTDTPVDFSRSDVELSVRYGTGPWPGTETIPLFTEEIFPVCSPKLVEGLNPLHEPRDLFRYTLLHDDMPVTWGNWLKAAGIEGIDAERGPAYMRSNLVIQAAIDGEGVALGRSRLVSRELEEGRLVKPFALSLTSNFSYFIVYPLASKDRPKIIAFRDWLLEEAAMQDNVMM
jgi:LysR family transcriptional regulator, glycine cleavage system transcriptional activator